MDPAVLGELFKTGGPALIYLAGLVMALRRIDALHELRHTECEEAHDHHVEALQAGWVARLQIVEKMGEECAADRIVLRKELADIRDRMIRMKEEQASRGPSQGA